jgi:DNA polymerase III epsilon subunit
MLATLPPITIFDLETTGLDPKKGHRILEIAGVRIENGQVTDKTFASMVNPERDIPWEAKQVNKITEEDVKNAPTIDVVLPQFLDFAAGTTLLAHNASFDYGFLSAEKEYCWGYIDLPECYCTMKLSQSLYPTEFRHSLDVISKKFDLPLPAERHRALADTVLLAQAFLKMMESGKVKNFEDLCRKANFREAVVQK